jgi:hypothetical protein
MKIFFSFLKPSNVKFFSLSTLLFILCLSISLRGVAQTTDPGIPKLSLNTAVGIGSNLTIDNSTITVPPISVSLDIKILPQVTIGPYISYEKNSYYGSTEYGLAGARGTYHFLVPSKTFGVYAGAILSYVYYDNPGLTALYNNDTHYTYNDNTSSLPNSKQSHFGYNIFIGGQAHLSNSVSAFAEFGYGIAYLNIGFSFKLK